LRKAYPDAQGVVVEPDAAWAARTRAASRRPWWSRPFAPRAPLTLGPGDAWPADPVELIWSNLALHHDPDPPQTFARWQGALAPGGFVMFSCLGPDSFKELRALYRDEGFGPCGHDFVDMHDLGDMLVHAGFADPVMDQERLTLTWSDAGRLLADLRLIGGNAAPARFAGLRTPRWRGRLLRRLESMRDPAGRIAMTAEVAYGHAFKVERAPRAAAPTTISVEALRATARTRAPRAVGGGE
jgi:malonyl-CoA O-methyltransferase